MNSVVRNPAGQDYLKAGRKTVHLGGIVAPGSTLEAKVVEWDVSLRARNLSPHTVHRYVAQVRRFAAWCGDHGEPDLLAKVSPRQIERYLADCLTTKKASSVKSWHGTLSVFFGWCLSTGELAASPMTGVKAPMVPEAPPPVLDDDALRALLKECEQAGTDFQARRDLAILRLLIDTGLRRSELAGLTLADLDLERREATVTVKGRRKNTVVYGHKAAGALLRYLRIREGHPDAALPNLWLGRLGPMSDNGIYKVVKRLGRDAGLGADIWPHLLRHTWVHTSLADEMQEGDVAQLAGWRSTKMLGRYGASRRSERARDAARRHQLGDRL